MLSTRTTLSHLLSVATFASIATLCSQATATEFSDTLSREIATALTSTLECPSLCKLSSRAKDQPGPSVEPDKSIYLSRKMRLSNRLSELGCACPRKARNNNQSQGDLPPTPAL